MTIRTGEMAQRFRGSDALPGKLSLVPITHFRWLLTAYTSSSRESVMLSSSDTPDMWCKYIYISAHYLRLLLLLWLLYPERMTKRNKEKKSSSIWLCLWSCIQLWVERTKESWEAETGELSVFSRRERAQSFFFLLPCLSPWLVLKDPRRHTGMGQKTAYGQQAWQ